MELCKKGRSNVQCLKKIARKLVKKQKQKKSVKERKNVKSKDLSNKYVIDLNVNLNIKKQMLDIVELLKTQNNNIK